MEYLTLTDRILGAVTKTISIVFTLVTVVLSFIVLTPTEYEYEKPLFDENYLFALYGISFILIIIAGIIESKNRNKYDALK